MSLSQPKGFFERKLECSAIVGISNKNSQKSGPHSVEKWPFMKNFEILNFQ